MPLSVTTAKAFTAAEVQEAKDVCTSAFVAFRAGRGVFERCLAPRHGDKSDISGLFSDVSNSTGTQSDMALLRLHMLSAPAWNVPQVTCTA
jgi:hypothetical protein